MSVETPAVPWPRETTDKPVPPPAAHCPWCGDELAQITDADRSFMGWTFVRRAYRCDSCAIVVHVDGDAVRAP